MYFSSLVYSGPDTDSVSPLVNGCNENRTILAHGDMKRICVTVFDNTVHICALLVEYSDLHDSRVYLSPKSTRVKSQCVSDNNNMVIYLRYTQ